MASFQQTVRDAWAASDCYKSFGFSDEAHYAALLVKQQKEILEQSKRAAQAVEESAKAAIRAADREAFNNRPTETPIFSDEQQEARKKAIAEFEASTGLRWIFD